MLDLARQLSSGNAPARPGSPSLIQVRAGAPALHVLTLLWHDGEAPCRTWGP